MRAGLSSAAGVDEYSLYARRARFGGRPGSCCAALPHRPAVEPSWRVATRQGGSLDVGMRFITIFLRKTLLGVSRSVGRLWIASFYMLYLCRKNLE